MTPEQAAAAFGRMADALPVAAAAATRESLIDALSTARVLSAGGLSLARLRRMHHPYRLGGAPPQDPAVINRQSGVFMRSWEIEQAPVGSPEVGGKVVNRSPQAEWLRTGTTRMISRPTVERVEEQVAPRHQARVEAAIARVMGG